MRAAAKRWLDNWKRVGPILQQERWDRVEALTDADAARDALWLFELWRPDWPTDEGEELVLHQRVFASAPVPDDRSATASSGFCRPDGS